MAQKRIYDFDEFIKRNFIVCSCGYRNKIENVNIYGTCLSCGKVLNSRILFMKKLKLELKKERKKEGFTK